jgi:hypothetical protein
MQCGLANARAEQCAVGLDKFHTTQEYNQTHGANSSVGGHNFGTAMTPVQTKNAMDPQ